MAAALRAAEGVYFSKILRGGIFTIFPARGYTPYPLLFQTPGHKQTSGMTKILRGYFVYIHPLGRVWSISIFLCLLFLMPVQMLQPAINLMPKVNARLARFIVKKKTINQM